MPRQVVVSVAFVTALMFGLAGSELGTGGRPAVALVVEPPIVKWLPETVEGGVVSNGHKPKALADIDGDGDLDVFA